MQTVRIDARPHPGQKEVHESSARFKLLACGRRKHWGKTRLGVNECLDVAAKGGRAWWVAPSYKMSEVGWRPLRQIAGKIGAEIRKVDRQVILPGGGEVSVRSADNPDSLRGEGLDFVVVDECAFVPELAWTEALRPALSDRQGRAMFISTPKGRNWFWRLWQRGMDDTQGEWRSWQFPTSGNPFIAPTEIDAARRDLPERIYLQEYEAQFLEDAGGVFRRVMEAATATELAPEQGHTYVMGVDWGKSNDFTVIAVGDVNTKRMVAMDRFNQIDYRVQRARLATLAERYNPNVIMAESNSMGEPIIEQLQADGLPVRGFTTTNATKAALIEALSLALERSEITLLNDAVLVGEMQAYEMDRLPSGMVRYSAPDGMHDDTVMATALMWEAMNSYVGIEALGIW